LEGCEHQRSKELGSETSKKISVLWEKNRVTGKRKAGDDEVATLTGKRKAADNDDAAVVATSKFIPNDKNAYIKCNQPSNHSCQK
jgi:hypothetical protein